MGTRLSELEVRQRLRTAFLNPNTVADHSLVAAPGAGFKIVVYGYQLFNNAGTANTVTFKSAANGIASGKNMAGNAGVIVEPGAIPLFECAANEALNLALSAATLVGVEVQYAVERT